MRHAFTLMLASLLVTLPLPAQLVVTLHEINAVSDKAVLKLGIENQCPETVIASRVAFFLMRADGQIVGRHSQWLIGHGQGLKTLPPGATTNWNVVVPLQGGIERVHGVFGPVILGSGVRATGRWEPLP